MPSARLPCEGTLFPLQRSQSFQSQYNPTQSATQIQTSTTGLFVSVAAMTHPTTNVIPSRNKYHRVTRHVCVHTALGPVRFDRRRNQRIRDPTIKRRNRSP